MGDLVETARGEWMPIRWVSRRAYDPQAPGWDPAFLPIRVSRFAVDDCTPRADLYLSPNHAVYIDGLLIPARALVNGISIAPGLPLGMKVVEYFHIVLDTHQVVMAEGLPVETRLLFETNLPPDLAGYERSATASWPMTPFAPLVGYGGRRERLRELARRGVSPIVRMYNPVEAAKTRLAAHAETLWPGAEQRAA